MRKLSLESLACHASLLVLISMILLGASASTQAKQKTLTAVADLRYGAALYHYYQGRELEALSELLVAKEKGGIQGHGDNPDIMEGGFYLGYGMELAAADIFQRLLDENRPKKTRDAAWFYMARLRYLRNDWAGAEQGLQRVSDDPEAELAINMLALQINLQLQQNNPDAAVDLFERKLKDSSWAPYLYYNIGAAYSRQGQYEKAIDYFNRLISMRQRDEAYLSLYDKAMTAAGYSYLLSDSYEEAIAQFSKVRLNSPMSSKALLGYGWASAEQEDYLTALKPWVILTRRQLIDENTQESYIAVPYAYEKLGRPSLALKHFREAEANFEAEIATLEDVISTLQGDALLEALQIDIGDDVNWLEYAKENNLTPQLSYLIELFSREDFQGLVQELRDLLAMQQNLRQWQATMTFYWDMLDEREINRQREMQSLMQRKEQYQLSELTDTRLAFDREITRIQREDDFFALLSGEQAEKVKVLKQAQASLALLKAAGEDVSEQEELLRWHHGQKLWAAQEAYSDNIWQVRKNLKLLDKNITELQAVEDRVQKIINDGFDLQPYRARISDMQARMRVQLLDIDETAENTKNVLRGKVEGVLKDQHVRLHQYLAQARLSIARLLDVDEESEEDELSEDLDGDLDKTSLDEEPLDESLDGAEESVEEENSTANEEAAESDEIQGEEQ